jgi:hypothetical protein
MSLSDWASIISAVILIGGLIFGIVKYYVNKSQPFLIKASLDSYGTRPSIRLTSDINLDLGESVILISVTPRIGTSLDKVNIRFVHRRFSPSWDRFWEYLDTDPNLLQITELEDVLYREKGEEWSRSYFESESDESGGFYGYYSPELNVKAGELVWYYVYVTAKSKWAGYLSFEGNLEQRRSWSRIKTRINASAKD